MVFGASFKLGLYEEQVDAAMASYLEYFLKLFYDAKEETLEEKRNEMYNVIKLVDKTRIYHTYSNPKVGCVTILCVMLDFWRDIDASIFLSVHGKYGPANALLRRWLETFITALYFDAELKKCDKDTELYKDIIKKRDKWLKKAPHRRFTGNECSVLSTLIDPDTDDMATQLMKETTSFSHSSFRGCVESLYRNLSKHVHFGGQPSLLEDWLKRGFAEYDEKLFEEWYDGLNQINEICNILTLLKFPEITGSDSEVDVFNAIVERCEREDKKLNEVVDELIRKGLERE